MVRRTKNKSIKLKQKKNNVFKFSDKSPDESVINEILDISTKNEVDVTILGEEVQGFIDYVSPISDPETKTFEIVVKVKNKDLRYKDGLSSIISIVKGNVLAHKISPSILALGDSGELGVKVIGSDNTVQFKKINVIEDTSDYMLVSGLSQKEKIII